MRKTGIAILVLVVLGNLSLWAWFNRPVSEIAWTGVMEGMSFSPYQEGQSPFEQIHPSAADIESDLQFLQGKTRSVRTYSSANGLEAVPEIAKKYGIRVTAGAWLDTRRDENEREIRNLIRNAKKYKNIERLIVGNEAILRGDVTVEQLTDYLRRVRALSFVPVSTAEPWHVWIKHPELAKEVDYIAIHVLPYWEGVPADQAVTWALERYEIVKKAFPGKPVVFGEVGWPSAGNRFEYAKASQVSQARFVRGFLNLAQANNLDYFIMEAFDQPWKDISEGAVGKYWGVYDVSRQAKFPMTGELVETPLWPVQAGLAIVLALLPMALFLLYWQNLRLRGQLFYAGLIQAVMSVLAWTLLVPFTEHLSLVGQLVWGFLLPAQLALLIVMLVNGLELTEMLWTRQLRRFFKPLDRVTDPSLLPKVSLHLAIHNEPPEMVKRTLDSLARLDYPDFEVLVLDNNTRDESVWKPVEAYCALLGSRFRFFHLANWPGYKAGALNFGLRETHPDAQVVGVVDSDYVVKANWLRSVVPYFAKPQVGFVQAPQDNREWQQDSFKSLCNWEYKGFFEIGMVQRNERNAIIQHGTMTLIRRQALADFGGWDEGCICEDAELGLRFFEKGYESVYVNHDFGHGLTPDSFAAYKGQRFRWAYGAVQILRKHWGALWGSQATQLTRGQRFHFLTGWLPWFADALHLLFTFAGVLWTIGLVLSPKYFEFPMTAFLIPTLGMFLFKVTHALWLYQAKVQCTVWQRIGAAVAGMGLTHTIARAIFQGLFTKSKPFLRTPKGEDKPAFIKGLLMAWEETQMLILVWLAASAVLLRYGLENQEALIWVGLLLVQSIPYLAALVSSLVNSMPTLSVVSPSRNKRRVQTQLQVQED